MKSMQKRYTLNDGIIEIDGLSVAEVGLNNPTELDKLIESANLGLKYQEKLNYENGIEEEMNRTKMERYCVKRG